MGESLMMRRRVRDEGFRVVNLCQEFGTSMAPIPPSSDPLQRKLRLTTCQQPLIRREQALLGITGHKGRVGGCVSPV